MFHSPFSCMLRSDVYKFAVPPSVPLQVLFPLSTMPFLLFLTFLSYSSLKIQLWSFLLFPGKGSHSGAALASGFFKALQVILMCTKVENHCCHISLKLQCISTSFRHICPPFETLRSLREQTMSYSILQS